MRLSFEGAHAMKNGEKLTDADIVRNRQERLRRAIDDSSLLVDFLSASNKAAPKEEVTKLIAIQHAYAENPALTEKQETAFWLAYSVLATAIRPATVEGIRYVAPNKNIGFFKWLVNNIWITGIVGGIALVYLLAQIHVVIGTTLVNRYNGGVAEFTKASQAEEKDAAKIDALASELARLDEQLADWNGFYVTRAETSDQLTRAQILLETLSSYLLPFILGMLGAATQVLRSVARRIAQQSLNPVLLPTYYIRVLLGYIIGTIIGLFMLPSVAGNAANPLGFLTSLPLLTAAFIAGYGSEVIFTALDKFVNDLRSYIAGDRSKDSSPAAEVTPKNPSADADKPQAEK
jgi:hypothetical protein